MPDEFARPSGNARRAGIEQQARGFAGAGSQNNGASVDAFFGACVFIDIRDAFRLAIFADDDRAGHGARNQREAASFHRGRQQHLAGAEIRGGGAAASALAAVVARSAAIDGARQNREARRDADDVEFVASLLDEQFSATGLWWRKEYTVRSAGNIFFGAKNTDVGFDFVVVRGDVLVSDGPVVAQTIARAGSESRWEQNEARCGPSDWCGHRRCANETTGN